MSPVTRSSFEQMQLVYDWIYEKGVNNLRQITNISL